MQQSGERYGLPPDLPFTTAALGGDGARGLSHLFGHPQSIATSGADMSSLHTLREHGMHLHRPSLQPHSEQYSSHLQHNIQQQQQLRGSAQQQHQQFLHPALVGGLHRVGFFTNQNLTSAQQQQLRAPHSPVDTTAAVQLVMAGPASGSNPEQFKLSYLQENAHKERERPASVDRWQEEEIAALVKIRSDMDSSFRDTDSKGPLWEEVSRKLQDVGYQRSPKKCQEKFEDIQRHYKKAKEEKHAGGGSSIIQRQELEFSSDFSSEGGHADVVHKGGHVGNVHKGGNVHNSDNNDEEHVENIDYRKKRKVGSWSPSKSFFERLTRQILEKQEGLHGAFLETIERKEKERVMREEAYRRQETARLNREQEIRAQEVATTAARDAALIAFLEKATGYTLSFPKVAFPPLSTPTAPAGANAGLMHPSESQDEMENGSDLNTRRWPKVEVHALIRFRSGMEPRFREAGPKAHLWHEISASMACLGFIRSPKRCKEKWENINKYFKKTKDSSKKRPENAKTCPYFHQLDALYQRGILTSSSAGCKLLGKAENLLEYNTEENEGNFNMQNENSNAEKMQVRRIDRESNAVDSAELANKLHHAEQQRKAKEIDNNDQMSMLEASQSSIFPSLPYNSNNISVQNQGSATATVVLSEQMGTFLHHHREGMPSMATKKAMQVEMFVKDVLDLQQKQHQKLVDEYDRMEQAHELRELERQQIKAAHPRTNTHDNATLMALVHKFAGDHSSDLAMSAPSSME